MQHIVALGDANARFSEIVKAAPARLGAPPPPPTRDANIARYGASSVGA